MPNVSTSAGDFEATLAAIADSRPDPVLPSAPAIEKVAVLGAGAVGQALACAALAAGCEARLHSAFGSELGGLAEAEAVTVRGESLVGSYRLSPAPGQAPHIESQQAIDGAIEGADAILVATPAVAHVIYAGLMAPLLTDGQIIALVPGRAFGAVEMARSLRHFGCAVDVTIVEVSSVPYLVDAPEPGMLRIHAVKRSLLAAALPNSRTPSAIAALRGVLPMLREGDGVLETTFSDPTAVLNLPAAILGAAAAPERAMSLRERLPGQLTGTVLDRLDAERIRIAFAFGVREVSTLREWLTRTYDLDGGTLDEVLDQIPAYGELPVGGLPATDGRTHDLVASSLVPFAGAAELAGVPAPATQALVDLASLLGGIDYRRHGRTPAGLGLQDLSADSIRRALDGSDPALLAAALA